MNTLIAVLEPMLDCFCIFNILKNVYAYTLKNKKCILIPAVVYPSVLCIELIGGSCIGKCVFGLMHLFNILYLKFSFRSCKFRAVINSLLTISSFNIIISSIIVFLLNKSKDDLTINLIGFFSTTIINVLCMLITNSKKINLKTNFQLIPISIKCFSLLSIISSGFLVSLILDYSVMSNISNWSNFTRIAIVFFIAVIGSTFPFLIMNSIGKSFYNKQAKIFEEQIDVQAKHYEELAKNNFELRCFKHDYKNMLIGVEKLIKGGHTDSALQLLQKQSEIISDNSQHIFDTGNSIVDAILIEKQKKAETVNSTIIFEGSVATENIAPTDLCVIFGNTLDNAIEACERSVSDTKNTILVICKSAGKFVFINISNPLTERPEIENNSIKTTKKDKTNHGFGIYSLKKTIKKYNGNVSFDYSESRFSVELELIIPA